jgi:probable HAF family extracellular repeat protein
MWPRTLFGLSKPDSSQQARRRWEPAAPPFRAGMRVEVLEDRSLPSSYAYTGLGTLGGSSTEARDLNGPGQVVGRSATASGEPHAFLWDRGVMIDLGTLGGPTSTAYSVNDGGQVVGSSATAGGATRPFLLTPEDTDADGAPDRWFRDVNADGANDLMAEIPVAGDINNRGQVVGGRYLWTPATPNGTAGTLTDLGPVFATAINDAGQVVGGRHLWTPTAPNGTAGVVTDLGAEVNAVDINRSGQVLVNKPLLGYFVTPAIWTPSAPNGTSGTLADLPTPWFHGADYTFAVAYSMNDAGGVVGDYTTGSAGNEYAQGSEGTEGVLWSGGEMSSLSLLLLPVREVTFPTEINNAGQILARGLLTPVSGPRVSISDTTLIEGSTGTRTATFTVTLSAASALPVTVAYATADGSATAGSDYLAASGTLTFAPGETTKTVTVVVLADRLPERVEDFVVRLTAASGAVVRDATGVGTITDDEPSIRMGDVTKAEGGKRQTTLFTFTVYLSAAYDQPVSVSFRTQDGTAKARDGDYAARSGTLTFAPGETIKTITIEVKGDSKRESDEYFILDLFGNSSNSALDTYRGFGTILNDD